MRKIETELPGVFFIEPVLYTDKRGYFYESFNSNTFLNLNIDSVFVQDNQSKSSYGVIRGLHFQTEPHAQAKLIRVLEGKIFDVAVDLRKNSPTFGKWMGFFLSGENHQQLYLPKGFAHGFSVVSRKALVQYKCDAYYNPKAEKGILYSDSFLNINWQIPPENVIISVKDASLPDFNEAKKDFAFSF